MSQENVQIIRVSFDVWNAGDMNAYRELLDPDIVSRPPQNWPEPGPFVGRKAVLREFEQLRETWEADEAQPIGDLVDLGHRVLARWVWRVRGRGPEPSFEMSCLYELRENRILRMDFFLSHADALQAAGLRE